MSHIKKVVSVSLGSSARNHTVELKFLEEMVQISRLGTDGDLRRAKELICTLDGQVDAIGLGGMDLYLYAGKKKYKMKEVARLANLAKKTPVVDGSGLKNSLERQVVLDLQNRYGYVWKEKKVLLVSALDRFGVAQTLQALDCQLIYGDLMFGLGIPYPLHSLSALEKIARLFLPICVFLPMRYLYPVGKKQEEIKQRYRRYYDWADVIAGDFHFIRRHLADNLQGKTILTNTVTKKDRELLWERGLKTLITTTPIMQGRSFGTNVLEALLLALSGKKGEILGAEEYLSLLKQIDFAPGIEHN